MKSLALLLEKLSFSYPSEPESAIFNSLSAEIPLDSETLILGGNASGKTTLARLLGGLDEPEEGRIIRPETLPCRNDPGWEPLAAGVVFENPGFQFQASTVREELEAGLIYRGAGAGEPERAIIEAAGELGIEPYLEMRIQDLEAPVQLAVLVASFLLLRPRLLVLDFSLILLEKTFRERLLENCRAPEGPAVVVLSRRAEDLTLISPEACVFLLKRGKLEKLLTPRDDPEVLEILESADIRLPWYAPLTAEFHKERLTSAIFYENENDFIGEISAALRRNNGSAPSGRESQ